MTLEALLDRALIKNYDRWAYFKNIRLVGDTLLVPNVYRADAINRMFLARLREAYPGLVVKAVTVSKSAADADPKPQASALRKQTSAFKRGKSPAERLAAAQQADMFGDGES